MTNNEMFEIQASNANNIVAKCNDVRRKNSVTNAIGLLLGRIVGAGNSLRVLREHAPHDFTFDGSMILRGIYDAMLQALFILSNPQFQEARASQYLDYSCVEKHKAIDLFDKSQTHLGHRISKSTRRANAEPEIEQEFQKVRQQFESKDGKVRKQWHEGTLRDLAKDVGLESEYEILQKQLSGIVHSSAWAFQNFAAIYNPDLLQTFAWKFSFRVLGKYTCYAGVTLDEIESGLVRRSEFNIFSDQNLSPIADL
jgi:hypothetical protein